MFPFSKSAFGPACTAALLALTAPAADPLAEGVRSTPALSPEEQLTRFRLPPGFEIQLVASEPTINKPMNMAFDAKGRLWVTTSIEYPWAAPTDRPARDRLVVFEDFDAAGRARKHTEFATGLNIPIGVYPFRTGTDGHWKAIAWSIPHNWLLEDTDGDLVADRRTPLYGPFDASRDTHGNQSSFTRGFDGWLYATHGFNNHSIVSGGDGHTIDMQSGNTYRMRLDGGRIEHFTHGQVNPFGMCFDAEGNLYSADCHSSPLYQLLAGGYYPSFGKPHDGLGFAPVMVQHSHGSTAISGIVSYEDNLWPEEYRSRMFVGNVMTSRLNQDEIEWRGSTPVGREIEDFLVCNDPWFRPVNLQLGPDGALYIADFYNRIIGHYEVPLDHPGRDRERGRIWRVIYTGDKAGKILAAESPTNANAHLRPAALAETLDGLITELASPNLSRRLLALNALVDQAAPNAAPALQRALNEPANAAQRVQLLWALHRVDALPAPVLRTHLQHDDSMVRQHALDILKEAPGSLLGEAVAALGDSDAKVRRRAAQVLAQHPSVDAFQPLVRALESADPEDTHLVYVLRQCLRDHLLQSDIIKNVRLAGFTDATRRRIAELLLAVPTPEAAELLVGQVATGNDALASQPDFWRHIARHVPEAKIGATSEQIRKRFAADTDFQLTLYRALEEGVRQRGIELPPSLRTWALELAGLLMSGTDTDAQWSVEPLADHSESANPWAFQERVQADTGAPARMLSSFPNGETLTGRLLSPAFPAPEQLRFFLAGHDGYPDKPAQQLNYVALLDAETGVELRRAAPPRNDVAQPVAWDLADIAGRSVRIALVDGDTAGAYAWLAFGRLNPPVVALPADSDAIGGGRLVAALQLLGGLGKGEWADTPSHRAAVRLARSDAAEPAVRAAALEALFGVRAAADLIRDPRVERHWRNRLADAVAADSSAAFQIFLGDVWKTAPGRVQTRVAAMLAATERNAALLAESLVNGEAPVSLLADRALREQLIAAAPDRTRRLDELVNALPPLNATIARLLTERIQGFDRDTADTARGRQLFTLACAVCHQVGGEGALVGPQLDGIGNRGLERLAEDVLDPNRNQDSAFQPVAYTLINGDVVTGIPRREEGALLVIADAAGNEVQLTRNEIVSQRVSQLSLMPANFGEALNQQDFNDLMSWLLEQR